MPIVTYEVTYTGSMQIPQSVINKGEDAINDHVVDHIQSVSRHVHKISTDIEKDKEV